MDTATGGQKPAKLETGAVVRVPLFINEGETIRVDTRTSEYLSRGKAELSLPPSGDRQASSQYRRERFQPAAILFIEAIQLRAVQVEHAEAGTRHPCARFA